MGMKKGGYRPRPLILVCILKLMVSHPPFLSFFCLPHRQNIKIARPATTMSSSPRFDSSPHPKTHFTTSPTPQPQNPHRAPLAINNQEPPVPLFIPRQLGPRPRRNHHRCTRTTRSPSEAFEKRCGGE